MAERRRAGRRNVKDEPQSDAPLSKEDEAIAKFVRFNCPTKPAMFDGNEVHYFQGKKAVDALVESKKYGAGARDSKFAQRKQAIDFLTGLMQRGMFLRARALVPKKKDEPHREKKEKVGESPRVKRVKQAEESAKDGDTAGESGAEQQPKKEEETKKKKKVKLVLHDTQIFNDDTDIYVWIFDPTPFYKKVIGLLIVFGVIAGCLFPLWPDWLRLGVYYLSVTGIALFGVLLGVALARTLLFCLIYAVTMGRHKLWLLPNLTEDCGFFESFQPWYTYEYCPPDVKKTDKKKKSSEEEPLVEDVKPTTESKSKPVVPEDPEPHHEETDPEEKYSKPSSDEDSAAEEDEIGEDEVAISASASTGDSSEPVDVVKLDEEPSQAMSSKPQEEVVPEKPKVEEPQPAAETEPAKPTKPRRRRVRRADNDEDYVMVQNE